MGAGRAVVVANGEVPPAYVKAGMRRLQQEGSVLNAVEEVARLVEQDTTYRSVGVGGIPGITGVVELDALIMDGKTRRIGAVGAVRSYAHPISIARRVMTDLPHVFLVGEGAERFAREAGFTRAELLTDESRSRWEERLVSLGLRTEEAAGETTSLCSFVRKAMERHFQGDTMNAVACDSEGNLAVAVSTSGLPLKYPGRIGDSPVPGAGGWADNRWGAACVTGVGELAIRCGLSLRAVLYLEQGLPVNEVGRRLLEELKGVSEGGKPKIRILLLTPEGTAAGFATWKEAEFLVLHDGEGEAERRRCLTLEDLVN